jgi:uncharacterized protein YndB with AHSA1/START domain
MPKFVREVVIAAPVEAVWNALIDPNHWSQWFPGVDGVSNATSTGVGRTFEWTAESRMGNGTVVKEEPMKRLEIATQMGNDKDEHVFVLQPSGGFLGLGANKCKVTYTLDTLMGGGILSNFLAGGNPKDVLRVKNAMDHLKKLVESH